MKKHYISWQRSSYQLTIWPEKGSLHDLFNGIQGTAVTKSTIHQLLTA